MKKKKTRLLLNLVEGEKHKHRVAMVNEEAEWNQHEPNTGMARMFFVMLLIHVVVIGGIIVYDWLNGEEAAPATNVVSSSSASNTAASALPPPAVNAADLAAQIPIEDCSTYEWRSGDSIASVAKKLNVSEDVLIKMNMLDKGTQLEANSIIRYPKEPVVRALGVGTAGANGDLPVAAPAVPKSSIAASEAAMALTAPGEQTFSFQSTIENELAPIPGGSSTALVKPSVQESPPPAVTLEATGEPAVKAPAKMAVAEAPPAPAPVAKRDLPKIDEAPPAKVEPKPAPKPVIAKAENDVPKAIPVKRYTPPAVAEKPVAKKSAPAPAAAKSGKAYTVKPGETLYSIASRNGISVKSLQAANKIAKPEALRDGMKLVIPGK
ncbi:MAG: LysM peptidoglycan-binding domain-containing protein [Verrucomicrobiota bacterium]